MPASHQPTRSTTTNQLRARRPAARLARVCYVGRGPARLCSPFPCSKAARAVRPTVGTKAGLRAVTSSRATSRATSRFAPLTSDADQPAGAPSPYVPCARADTHHPTAGVPAARIRPAAAGLLPASAIAGLPRWRWDGRRWGGAVPAGPVPGRPGPRLRSADGRPAVRATGPAGAPLCPAMSRPVPPPQTCRHSARPPPSTSSSGLRPPRPLAFRRPGPVPLLARTRAVALRASPHPLRIPPLPHRRTRSSSGLRTR